MRKQIIAIAMSIGVLGMATLAVPAQAASTTTTARVITVSGSGWMTVNRDQATTNLSVSNLASSAKVAINQSSATYNAIRNAIIAAGIDAKKITTSGLALYPEYDYNQSSGTQTLRGYRAIISMSVVSTVPLAGTVLDTAVQAGGDSLQIGGVSFDVANPDAVTGTTRSRAIANAKMKAMQYAKALGMRLGRATTVVENAAAIPTPIYYAKGMGGADSSISVDPGSQKVTSSVTVTFQLLP